MRGVLLPSNSGHVSPESTVSHDCKVLLHSAALAGVRQAQFQTLEGMPLSFWQVQ